MSWSQEFSADPTPATKIRHLRGPSPFCFLGHICLLSTLAAASLSTSIITAKDQARRKAAFAEFIAPCAPSTILKTSQASARLEFPSVDSLGVAVANAC